MVFVDYGFIYRAKKKGWDGPLPTDRTRPADAESRSWPGFRPTLMRRA